MLLMQPNSFYNNDENQEYEWVTWVGMYSFSLVGIYTRGSEIHFREPLLFAFIDANGLFRFCNLLLIIQYITALKPLPNRRIKLIHAQEI